MAEKEGHSRVHKMSIGNAMSVKQIDRICRMTYTPVVFMTGEVSCGKTTLIASLHDAFLFGPIGHFRFAGSQTLLGFEERCFESRAKSKGLEPKTPRTRYESGQEYFHLSVEHTSKGSRHNLLFADMSGEFYERSLHSKSEISHFEDLRRAQVLLLVLDGGKLAQRSTRQAVRSNALSFLRRCSEESVLRSDTILQVLVSKWDEVASLPDEAQKATLDFVSSRLNEKALDRQVSITPIASRPGLGRPEEKLFGVRELFPGWINSTPVMLTSTPHEIPPPHSQAATSFGRFAGIGVRK